MGARTRKRMTYSIAFKAGMIKRMTGRGAVSAAVLSKESGVSQSTLSQWKRRASRLLSVANDEAPSKPNKRAQDWTPDEKLRAVSETSSLDEAGLGAYLRRHGLHGDQLDAWRQDVLSALSGSGARGAMNRPGNSGELFTQVQPPRLGCC